ncbi:MAG: NADH-quinone oxidoreductase subunit H [Candidatus Tenebribacter burtonii]|jgi:NADH-quinone oxidoreductase subunit H|nr:NADH-quinone oxidoreductase subunit H [Candidatus Tenebribacter burtonii]
MNIWIKILYAVISVLVVTIYGLTLGGIVRKIYARVHGRYGPSVWQPFLDIIKTHGKRVSISHGYMFYLGPIFRLAGGLGTYLFIPVIFGSVVFSNFSIAGDLLLVMYFIFFGQLGMALGAGEGGHPYSPLGIARGLSQMTAFEVPFSLAVIAIAIQYNTFNLTTIVAAQQGSILNWTLFTNPLAVVAAMISLLGMNMHPPFSIVLAPQEIPIGPPIEMNSSFLATLQTNRGLFTAAKLILFMNLFFGGATNLPIMIIKTFLIYMFSVFVGASFPRFRPEQSMRFFLKWPTLIGVASIIFIAYF